MQLHLLYCLQFRFIRSYEETTVCDCAQLPLTTHVNGRSVSRFECRERERETKPTFCSHCEHVLMNDVKNIQIIKIIRMLAIHSHPYAFATWLWKWNAFIFHLNFCSKEKHRLDGKCAAIVPNCHWKIEFQLQIGFPHESSHKLESCGNTVHAMASLVMPS